MIRLAVFDMDGTLTLVKSPWKHIYEKFSLWDSHGSYIYSRYKQGLIDYSEFCQQDVKVWASHGITLDDIEQVLNQIPMNRHISDIFALLHETGIKICLISTGFFHLAKKICRQGSMSFSLIDTQLTDTEQISVWANEIKISGQRLVCELNVSDDIEHGNTGRRPCPKLEILQQICGSLSLKPESVVVVGDGPSDRPMMEWVTHSFWIQEPDDILQVQSYLT